VGTTAAYAVESKQFLSSKLTLGRAPGAALSSYWKLNAGEHRWPFQIQLPDELPPSVTHPSGAARIVYEVRAHMVVPGDRDGKAFVLFTVISLPRLRVLHPKMVERVVEKSFGLQTNEPLLIRAQLQHDVYCPGELLRIKFFVDNASRKTLNGFRFEIVCTWRYAKQTSADVLVAADFAPTDVFPLPPRAIVQTVAGCRLPDPPLTQSVAGRMLSCTYKLHVTAALAGITTRDIQFDMPFVLISERPPSPPGAAAPPRRASASAATTTPTPPPAVDLMPPPQYPPAPALAVPAASKLVRHGASEPPPAPVRLGDAVVRHSLPAALPSAPPQSRRVSSTPIGARAPQLVVEAPADDDRPPPYAPWVDDDDWVKIDDKDEDGVLDLAENTALPPYNPELGLLSAPNVSWGVSPGVSPQPSPRSSPAGSPKLSPRR
jgi:hypothetical protein